ASLRNVAARKSEASRVPVSVARLFFFKQKTAYEIGLGIPAEPLFRSPHQNQRYGSSHIGATAKDISNVVTDAASGVVDIFHGIRSEERRVGKECRSRGSVL